MIDYLIVGQGTAGTMLAHFLNKTSKSFMVLDDGLQTSSSIVAAGIVNPITGKRYVKSWRIDEFLPFAKQTYIEISKLLNKEIIVERNVVRMLNDEGQENDWFARSAAEGYEKYFVNNPETEPFKKIASPVFSYGEIRQSFQVRLYELLPLYRDLLEQRNQYTNEVFDFGSLIIHNDHITYKNTIYKQIIFAEGYRVTKNPYFNALPFVPVKGEILIIKIPEVEFPQMLKHHLFIVPLYDDIYWVGSNYQWDYQDNSPSKERAKTMKELLDKILKVPYKIISHKAGIRPSFKNRRPTIIHHPKYDNMILFNGFGAKGTSLAPYWAQHLVNHLVNGSIIDREVSVLKYIDLLDKV